MELFRGKINFRTWGYRLISIFQERLHRIPEIAQFDEENGIPSEFFFGMDNALGLSYKQQKAKYWIEFLRNKGFGVGVHGINYVDSQKIKKEFDDFERISGIDSFGIRMHYVRCNENTLSQLADAGYVFDTTSFDKEMVQLKQPFQIGSMWEFPLHLMDVYVLKYGLNNSKNQTIKLLNQAKISNLSHFTILLHDNLFNKNEYPDCYEWYKWLISYLNSEGYAYTSYRNAIKELSLHTKSNHIS